MTTRPTNQHDFASSGDQDADLIVDVLVIGAGLAGLAAAAAAATDGASVLVLERASVAGGRARSEDRNGFVFNRGGHALYTAGVGAEVLGRLGVQPDGVRPKAQGVFVHPRGIDLLPVGPASLVRTRLLGARQKLAFARAHAAVVRADPIEIASVPLRSWIEQTASDRTVRELLYAMIRLTSYTNAPDIVSAGAVIEQLQAATSGVLYLHGGWQRLVEQLVATARTAGAAIETSVEASVIRRCDDHWLTAAGGRTLRSRTVVIAGASPAATARLLELEPDAFAAAGPAVRAAVLDLSLRTEPRIRFALASSAPTYFSVHGPPAEMAPPGCAAAVAMKYLPVGEESGVSDDRRDLDAIVTAAGVDEIEASRFLRAMTVSHGLPLAASGGLSARPSVCVPGLAGAYIAGDWVGERGMLADASLASGEAAGRAAAQRAARSTEEEAR